MTLLHMTTAAEWAAGRIEPAPGEAFIHLSRPDQLHTPANLFYGGRRDLILLAVDPDRLTAEVKVEGGFPHLYGPLLADAVFDVLPFPADDDGSFHLLFAPMSAAEAPAADLIEAMVQEMDALYGGRIDGDGMPSATPADFERPKGTFLVGYLDGEPVTGGGVKTLAPGLGEIKRMYVAPHVRGQGIARRLLTALEEASWRLGHERVRLDTGPDQPHAKALYESAGYVEIPDYNDNPKATYCGATHLS
ncbi:MAG: GCN5-related N-acetyltransferase [Actinomycetia bacterium]|nr:GCN5-related N-acetyltransferase [Actinomycetes bacterium]